MNILIFLIILFGVVNLVRMTVFVIGSDIYSSKARTLLRKQKRRFYPYISVVVPAYNEEKTILRAVKSIIRNKYPRYKREVIVVDDGSTDGTFEIVKKYKESYNVQNLTLIHQKNKGKAHALNKAIKRYAKGEIVMCLDSDSYLESESLKKAVSYFKNPQVAALSSNVKIIPTKNFLNFIQRFEYIVGYQMKRAQTIFNIEYIIGGVGSTFRKSILKKVGYYDANTLTEDIDLTMKIIQLGNKENRVIYGANVIAYTESVLNIQGLIKQRSRWKWGRTQTFLKNRSLFFNRDNKFSKSLTFIYLPYAIFGDIAFLFEPFLIALIFYIAFWLGDITTFLSVVIIMSTYLILNILLEDTLTFKQKIKYILLAPLMYLFFYILSLAEYIALLKSLSKLLTLKQSISRGISRWEHVERLGLKQS